MTKKELKELFDLIAVEYGFKKHRYMYVKDYEDFMFRVSLQNPLDSDDYYFYCYFLAKAVHSKSSSESFLTADITGSQSFITDNGKLESIQIKDYSKEDMSKIIRNSMNELLKLIETGGIKAYLKENPETIDTIPMRSKDFLEKEGIIDKSL